MPIMLAITPRPSTMSTITEVNAKISKASLISAPIAVFRLMAPRSKQASYHGAPGVNTPTFIGTSGPIIGMRADKSRRKLFIL
jgi:hypothetical protein